MGDYQLKIGLQTYDVEVKGSEDFSETIVRDFTDKLLRIRGNYQFTGYQGLYDVLYNNIISEGVCNSLEGKVYYRGDETEPYVEVWRGELKPQDIEFDLLKYSAGTQILDNSWSSRFNNSKDQKVFLRSNDSKTISFIQECPFYEVSFFDPTDSTLGNYLPDERTAFRVFDCFQFLINYHTDSKVSFTSDFFDIGGDGEQYYISTGLEIRTYDGTVNPEISFSELFTEMNKKLNLWIIIEGTLESPVLRIEPAGYSLEESVAIEVQNPESITLKTDLEQLYTVIKVGSTQTDFDTTINANYPNARYESWSDEEYNTAGDCEFENSTLDLLSSWKIDSNSIESCIGGNEDFDNDIFIIEIDPSSLNCYKFTDDVTTAVSNLSYFYNFNLKNDQVIDNWFDVIPSVVTKALSKNYYVYADDLSVVLWDNLTQFPAPFDNDSVPPGADADNIYNTPTANPGDPDTWGRVDVPVSGFYKIETSINLGYLSTTYDVELSVQVWEGGTSRFSPTVIRKQVIEIKNNNTSNVTVSGSTTIFASGGEQIGVFPNITSGGGSGASLDSGFMELNAVSIYDIGSSDDPLIYLYDIQRFKLSDTDYNTLKTNKTQQIRFIDTLTQRTWQVWPKEMTWNRERQIVTSGEFIGRAPTNALCWVLEGGIWDDACYWIDSKSWIDCGTQVIESSDFTGNPLSGWTLGGTTTQTGVGTFQDSGGGPLYQVTFTQSITLTAGSYTLFYDFSISGTPNWNGAFSLTNSDIPATSWVGSTNTQESGSIDFTVTGSSSRTLSLTFDTFAVNPTFTTTLLNICA